MAPRPSMITEPAGKYNFPKLKYRANASKEPSAEATPIHRGHADALCHAEAKPKHLGCEPEGLIHR